jgi:hypothetical protein
MSPPSKATFFIAVKMLDQISFPVEATFFDCCKNA